MSYLYSPKKRKFYKSNHFVEAVDVKRQICTPFERGSSYTATHHWLLRIQVVEFLHLFDSTLILWLLQLHIRHSERARIYTSSVSWYVLDEVSPNMPVYIIVYSSNRYESLSNFWSDLYFIYFFIWVLTKTKR